MATYSTDKRVVLTLDAGGTNFVFSAISGNREIVEPKCYKADPHHLDNCLSMILQGFEAVNRQLSRSATAISFAFPGPADYKNGIIGDLPNFPAFCGGIALGPMLREHFRLPVFINNDGCLFAYGEALAGALPDINAQLECCGNPKRYANLLGVTLGTGFGGGVVVDGHLLTGDNDCGSHLWCFRNKHYPTLLAEESVGVRAVKRVYKELTQYEHANIDLLEPVDIFNIAEGEMPGDRDAAIASFRELGTIAGDVIAQASALVDGIVVIGGGVSKAAKYILPSLIEEMNGKLNMYGQRAFQRLSSQVYNLEIPEEKEAFLQDNSREIAIPFSDKSVVYNPQRAIGVTLSRLGANKAIALGAYSYALAALDKK
ncbi:MAG: ROK family protein [Dysgonamonadaceae bacterium]|jgi:glucokinase|nr:ROK family protein [Dysgonamonadaceae bacterium]